MCKMSVPVMPSSVADEAEAYMVANRAASR
jgi:hypothetical protein